MKKVLALSSSRVGGGAYLEAAAPLIKNFLGDALLHIAFVPFASVDGYDDYINKVEEGLTALQHSIQLAEPRNAKKVIEECDAIMIGGGNTFKLLHDLYKLDLVQLIREKVEAGTPYIGWSAGSNLCGPTICTTNDMPIIQPKSFEAFGFFPFQINPHYYNVVMKDFHGETRDQRLEEFLKLNPTKRILCLPEGTAVKMEDGEAMFSGIADGVCMSWKKDAVIKEVLSSGTNLSGYADESDRGVL